MKKTVTPLGLLLGLALAGCHQPATEGNAAMVSDPEQPAAPFAAEDDQDEVEIPIDQIPAGVRSAALVAVPGLEIAGAEREVEDGVTLYSIEGKVNGKPYEVEVTARGKVLEVEQEGDDDDDGDDDDEGDGD